MIRNLKTKLGGAKYFILGMLTMIVIFSLFMAVSARTGNVTKTLTYNDIKVVLDGETVNLTDLEGNIIELVLIDNTIYVPMSPLARLFGKSSTYDGKAKTLFIGKVDKPAIEVPLYNKSYSEVGDSNGFKATGNDKINNIRIYESNGNNYSEISTGRYLYSNYVVYLLNAVAVKNSRLY